MASSDIPAVTLQRLVYDLKELGVRSGQVMMLHVSVKAIGRVVGGPDVVIQALLEVLGADGTLMMYVKSEEPLDQVGAWPDDWKAAYWDACPPFDPLRTRANRKWSILTEYLRTWPGALRSNHPEAGVVAVGKDAEWITKDHPWQYGYGAGSPLAKLCDLGGQVLLLGATFDSLTLLHHAEHVANLPNKKIERYRWPMMVDGKRQWVDFEQYDTSDGIVEGAGEDYFDEIATEYLAKNNRTVGKVGVANSYLFDAQGLRDFAVGWLEAQFGA